MEDKKNEVEEAKKIVKQIGIDTYAEGKAKAIFTVLNYIQELEEGIKHQLEKRENQKRELTILNEKQKEFNKLINTIKSYKGQFRKQQKEIKNSIPKQKIKEILNLMKEEHDKAIERFMKEDISKVPENGGIAQELGYLIGKIEELLEEE